jgi:hypothetical protein
MNLTSIASVWCSVTTAFFSYAFAFLCDHAFLYPANKERIRRCLLSPRDTSRNFNFYEKFANDGSETVIVDHFL